MKYILYYKHKVWHKNEVQKIEVYNLFIASTEFSRLMRLPGILYVKPFIDDEMKLFDNSQMIAYFKVDGL